MAGERLFELVIMGSFSLGGGFTPCSTS